MAFEEAMPDQAFAKVAMLGLQGSGKTYTTAEIAIGLHKMLTDRGLPGGGSDSIYMLDTEVGAGWLVQKFSDAGIKLMVDKTRAFYDLAPAIEHVASKKGILIIDSITHFWQEIQDTYQAQNRRKYGLRFDDWGKLKKVWREGFTDLLVNSECHIVMCGRQGYEYGYFEEDGKKQLEKTAVKMKAESETGYEPSLLVNMERHQELDDRGGVARVWRSALILKDRSNTIDGQTFENPTFLDLSPHFERLALGGKHTGVDTSRTSVSVVPRDDNSWREDEQRKEIELEEILELVKKHYPSQSNDDKQYRAELFEKVFSTRSWTKIGTFGINDLKVGHNELSKILDGKPVYPDLDAITSGSVF